MGSAWVPLGLRLGSGWVPAGFRLGSPLVPLGFRLGSAGVPATEAQSITRLTPFKKQPAGIELDGTYNKQQNENNKQQAVGITSWPHPPARRVLGRPGPTVRSFGRCSLLAGPSCQLAKPSKEQINTTRCAPWNWSHTRWWKRRSTYSIFS